MSFRPFILQSIHLRAAHPFIHPFVHWYTLSLLYLVISSSIGYGTTYTPCFTFNCTGTLKSWGKNGYLDVKLTYYASVKIHYHYKKSQSHISDSISQTWSIKWTWNLILNVVSLLILSKKVCDRKAPPTTETVVLSKLILISTSYFLISTLLIRNSYWIGSQVLSLSLALSLSLSLIFLSISHWLKGLKGIKFKNWRCKWTWSWW